MAHCSHCSPNLQTSIVILFIRNRQITSLVLKMERKNIKRCLGGPRMQNQHEQSPQTFLINNFYFLQPWRKQDD